jgi:hypothetical protein
MPNAVTTQGQGADAFISMPSCTINAGTNTGISGIEIDVKPLTGSAAGFINLFGVSSTNVTALRINTATQTLQWRYSSTVYLESAAGTAPLNERHKYGAEWEESTLSLYLTKNGVRIAGPYVAPSAGSLITNVPWNQIGKVGSTAPGGAMAFELYGVRTYGNNCSYQSQWDETGASGAGTAWANDSVDRNLNLTSFAGTSNSWWVFYSNLYIGEGTFNAIATASVALTGSKIGNGSIPAVVAAAVAGNGCKIGTAQLSTPIAAGIEMSAVKVGVAEMPIEANAEVDLYSGNLYIGTGTFSVSADANVTLVGSKVGCSAVEFVAVATSYLNATKTANSIAPVPATSALAFDGYKIGYAPAVVHASVAMTLSGGRVTNESAPVTVVFIRTSSKLSYNVKTSSRTIHSVKTTSRYQYHLKTFSGGDHA